VLVVTQKAVEAALKELGNLPRNIDLAHHNAVAGRDEWRDVAAVVVVGRCQAKPEAVEWVAEALTGAHIPPLAGWYPRNDAVRELSNGSHVRAEADRHPEPLAEAVRWSVCEGELVQIIGRGRGVNRTAGNPLDVLVLTDVPLPVPLAGMIAAKDINPTPLAEQLAAGGIAFEGPNAAAAAYPGLWRSAGAAQMAWQRERLQTSPYRDSYYGNVCNLLSKMTYQLEGAGRVAMVAWFDPALISNPAAWIAERLGPVKWAKIDQATGFKADLGAKAPDVPELARSAPVKLREPQLPRPSSMAWVNNAKQFLRPNIQTAPGFFVEPMAFVTPFSSESFPGRAKAILFGTRASAEREPRSAALWAVWCGYRRLHRAVASHYFPM
jgi:putative DNA primase/helicase